MLKKKQIKKPTPQANEVQANELNSLIEEMLSLVGGTDISKMEIKRILEENNFQKERVVEVILEKRENQKKMAKNLAVKKIQGVSSSQQKKNLKTKDEDSRIGCVLYDFFKVNTSTTRDQHSKPYTISIPSHLLREISLNFKVL